MLAQTQNRVETILQTIDRLGIVKIKHLCEIHELSYRNSCRIITTQLRPFINEHFFNKEKVICLNKKGREFIASEKEEVTINAKTFHSLLRNEVYIHFNCPQDWENEHIIHAHFKAPDDFEIIIQGLNITTKKTIVSDAVFKRNGYWHVIEVDNERKMIDNKKKIELYKEILPGHRDKTPILYYFTKTENRKRKLQEWLKGIRHEVVTFGEIH